MVTSRYYQEYLAPANRVKWHKYSNASNDLLREAAFCLVPAAPVANYLDIDPATRPTVTVSRMGAWSVILEGANTYSPDPQRKAARARMEREVYRRLGVLIVPDYLVNSGAVIYAAQERLVKTPAHIRIPDAILGKRKAVDKWLEEREAELADLAEQRRLAAEAYRDELIRHNMRELIDLLVSDADLLPSEAAERISVRRIARRARDRSAVELMEPITTIAVDRSVREAAACMVAANSPILAVVSAEGDLAGVVTEWDITRATAQGSLDDQPLEQIMSRQVISARPDDSVVDVIRNLEYHEFSALPVVENGVVQGMITADVLTHRSLLWLLQAE